MRKKRRLVSYIAFAITFFIISSYIYAMDYYKAEDEISVVFNDNGNNIDIVSEEKYTKICSNKSDGNIGFIFYPGAKIEEEAYIPFMKRIASKGYDVFLVKMPLRFAVLDKSRADDVIRNNNNINNWVIGGHSLGGAMAASYAKGNDKIKGLVLYGAYPSNLTDLSESNMKVLSIWGSNDKVVDREKIEHSKKLLPKNSVMHELEGGNHSGFGNYGLQKKDGEASLDKDKQQIAAVEYTLNLMESLKEDDSKTR